MKRALFITALVLAVFLVAGCSTWEETTLTVVNDSGEDIENIEVYIGSISRSYAPNNILESNLADGESIEIPLAPVLHPDSNASISIDEKGWSFTYAEGAEVVFTFNGNEPDFATWEGGDFALEL